MLENFRSYQLAVEFHKACESLKLPKYSRDQLHRASLSIALNLAEGSARPSAKERRRFYVIALGSLREAQAILDLNNVEAEKARADRLGAHVYKLTRA